VKRPRKHITQRTMKVAALRELAQFVRVERDGQLVPAITYEQAKDMTEAEIEAFWHWDHIVPHAIGGSCEHYNLQPMIKQDHALKTAKKDIPQVAKTKRISAKEQAFRASLLRKSGQGEVDLNDQSSHKPTRKQWPGGRKMQSRPFPKRGRDV
jgi:hypothetical protein